MTDKPPRRKVIRIERVPVHNYHLKFTLECGHIQIRTRHQECATLVCLHCQHIKEREEKARG